MSEHSSDSDSSCGWTVINHEGSDIDAVAADSDSASGPEESALEECPSPAPEENQQADFNQSDTSLARAASQIPLEPHKAVHGGEKGQLLDASSCVGAGSDDSDIVTLEVPKVEEIGNQEEPALVDEEDFNMGSSSSSQYTFCQPETVFPPQPSGEESSSDETSHCSSPALRRRRAKKRLISSSESEETLLPHEPETKQVKHLLSSGLNRCIILALVIAVSMGFGHFYGTVQIQKQQQLVEKTHEDELQEMKGNLLQCQQEQGSQAQCKSLKESLATCVLTTEMEKKSFESQRYHLASENQHLRESLQKEEKALALLQGELHKLQEHVRLLESNGPESQIFSENQELRVHLEEEKHRMQCFMKQRETLLVEAQMLRQELDQERQGTAALRETLETLSSQQESPEAEAGLHERQEIDTLRGMLTELEKKLSFEQQRSDLWEKLYIEVKGHAEKQAHVEKSWKPTGQAAARGKGKPKSSFFASVKDTFDAMKNSTKEFVRHHKEKIKEAKEAVKENLKKFSDSVTSTFRHFKDSTKNIFEGREKKYGDRRHEANRKGRTVYQADASPEKQTNNPRAPGRHFTQLKGAASGGCSKGPACSRKHHALLQGCSGIFDCAHQEFVSLFNKELDPIQAEEFNQLMHKYLQQKVRNFHHWRELEIFVNQFFRNGIFIHDQMLFSDFVSDIKDYLEDIKEYQRHSERVFEDLDKYIYQHYFHYDQLPQPGCSHPNRRPPFTSPYSPQQERQVPKHQQRHKRDVRWQKQGRANGRHTANLEIELGRLPFDPKY